MKTIAVDIGHNATPDTGAVSKKYKEDDLTKEVSLELIELLESNGYKALKILPTRAISVNDSLRQRVDIANSSDADFFVSIHFNCFDSSSANGVEVFCMVHGNETYKIAKRVSNEISNLGFKNRGAKCNPFYVIRCTKMPAILVECCFISSETDMDRYDKQDMAEAIFKGLIGKESKPIQEVIKLKIIQDTLLKPSTEQSNRINVDQLRAIKKGVHPCILIGEEESHYLVKLPDEPFKSYIYTEHAEITK